MRANPDNRKASSAGYYGRNKTIHAERVKRWADANPDKVKEIAKRSRDNNPESAKEYRRIHGAAQLRRTRAVHSMKYKARNKVNNSIASGKMPKASTFVCVGCTSPATQYHHHKGYEEKHWLDVVPMCVQCHAAADAR